MPPTDETAKPSKPRYCRRCKVAERHGLSCFCEKCLRKSEEEGRRRQEADAALRREVEARRASAVNLHCTINVPTSALAGWSPEQVRAFMAGVTEVIVAQKPPERKPIALLPPPKE
jgi:hypothetical protein